MALKYFIPPPKKKNKIFKNHNQLEGGDRGGGRGGKDS